MPKSSAEPTNADNLEAKFDAGEDVLDYFEIRTVRVVAPMKARASLRHGVSDSRRTSMIRLMRAIRIAEKIQELEDELNSILNGGSPAKGTARQKGQPAVAGAQTKVVH